MRNQSTLSLVRPARIRRLSHAVCCSFSRPSYFASRSHCKTSDGHFSPIPLSLSFASSLFFSVATTYYASITTLSFLPRHIDSNPRKEKARFPQKT